MPSRTELGRTTSTHPTPVCFQEGSKNRPGVEKLREWRLGREKLPNASQRLTVKMERLLSEEGNVGCRPLEITFFLVMSLGSLPDRTSFQCCKA